MANRYLIITRTPSDGIEFGLTHSLGAWKGLQRQTHLLVLTFADTTLKGLPGMGMPEEAPRNGVSIKAAGDGGRRLAGSFAATFSP